MFFNKLSEVSASINCKSVERITRYSASEAEPRAMFKKWENSLSELLPHPSLIFVGIEVTALRNWDVILNSSVTWKPGLTKWQLYAERVVRSYGPHR